MKFALCNEVLAHLPFEEQCRAAAALGYAALELAPYTVFEDPARASDDDARAVARTAAAHGLSISGLHWLLVRPEGLSITSADRAVHARTVAFMRRLVALAAVMGARYLVHGSPKQRAPAPGQSLGDALARATEAFARAGDAARDAEQLGGDAGARDPAGVGEDRAELLGEVEQGRMEDRAREVAHRLVIDDGADERAARGHRPADDRPQDRHELAGEAGLERGLAGLEAREAVAQASLEPGGVARRVGDGLEAGDHRGAEPRRLEEEARGGGEDLLGDEVGEAGDVARVFAQAREQFGCLGHLPGPIPRIVRDRYAGRSNALPRRSDRGADPRV